MIRKNLLVNFLKNLQTYNTYIVKYPLYKLIPNRKRNKVVNPKKKMNKVQINKKTGLAAYRCMVVHKRGHMNFNCVFTRKISTALYKNVLKRSSALHPSYVFFSTETNQNIPKEDNEKNASSWKQLLALRLFIFFGVLIFLLFSYLLSESFNIHKVYTQIIRIYNDDTAGDQIYMWIRTCWKEYISIWDIRQWTISIVGIVPGYWYLFDVLFWVGIIDKRFTPSQKVFFISTDLFLNFVVGLVYMGLPDTIIGDLMYQCPVALSPYFIVIELTLYLLYRLWLKYNSKIKN